MGRNLLVITAILVFFLGNSQISGAESSMSSSSEIYIEYYSRAMYGEKHSIIIYRDGSVWADKQIINWDGTDLIERRLGKLTEAEITDLIETVIKENDFFSLAAYINTGLCDGEDEKLTVVFQGKTHSAGGIGRQVKDRNFGNILNKINRLSSRFSEYVLSLSEWQNFCRVGQKIKVGDSRLSFFPYL
jgi:hypothetical protein